MPKVFKFAPSERCDGAAKMRHKKNRQRTNPNISLLRQFKRMKIHPQTSTQLDLVTRSLESTESRLLDLVIADPDVALRSPEAKDLRKQVRALSSIQKRLDRKVNRAGVRKGRLSTMLTRASEYRPARFGTNPPHDT